MCATDVTWRTSGLHASHCGSAHAERREKGLNPPPPIARASDLSYFLSLSRARQSDLLGVFRAGDDFVDFGSFGAGPALGFAEVAASGLVDDLGMSAKDEADGASRVGHLVLKGTDETIAKLHESLAIVGR